MSTFAEYTKKKKKEEEAKRKTQQRRNEALGISSMMKSAPTTKGTTFKEYTSSVLGVDFDDDIAPVRTTVSDEKEEKKEKDSWFKSGAFDDGYQFGDVTKTILGTTGDLLEDAGAGILGMGEKLTDAMLYLSPYVVEATYYENGGALQPQRVQDINRTNWDSAKEKAAEIIQMDWYNEEEIAKSIISNPIKSTTGFDIEEESVLGTKSDALAQSAGQLAATAGLQAVGVPWYLTTGVTSFGAEAENALNQGATMEEAGLSAIISAGAEILTEKLSGGIKFGGKTLDDALTKRLATSISNKVVRNGLKVGMDVAGEGSEEVLSSVFSRLGSALYKEESIDELLTSEEAVDEYIDSFIGGAILGGVASTGKTIKSGLNGVDEVTGLNQSEQKVFDKVYNDAIAEAEADGKKLTQRDKTKLYDATMRALEKGYIDTDTIESVLGGETYNSYKSLTEQESALKKEIETLENLPREQITVKQGERLAEIREQLKALDLDTPKNKLGSEVSDLVKGSRLFESYNEKSRRGQTFEADLSQYTNENAKKTVQNFMEHTKSNNTNATHDFVDLLTRVSEDRGHTFDFTTPEQLEESIRNGNPYNITVDPSRVEAFVDGKNNTIVINMKANKSLNSLVGHEITHTVEKSGLYDGLQKSLFKYAEMTGEYADRLESIKRRYANLSEEAQMQELTADLIGDYVFTDEDFVHSLSAEQPNIFKRIYNEIKYFCKMATTGSREARELERAKHMFEKIYRESSETYDDSDVKFSIRKEAPPKNTGVAYKVFYVKDGKLYPPMVANPDGEATPVGVWLNADVGASAPPSKTGRAQVKAGGKGTQGGSGSLAFRPGWHLGDLPRASQFDRVNPENGKKELFPENFVWAEVEYAKDADYQDEAMSYGYTDNGKFRHAYAGLPKIPENGYYKYRTNPKPDTVPWIITGAMKVNRILSDAEVNAILEENGVSPVHRQGGDVELEKFGFNNDGSVKYSVSDSTGRQLTKGQQEFFKNSKARDDDGNLMVVYHGSKDYGFTTFDTSKSDDDMSLFFTNSADMANSYVGDKAKLYEVYLNLENPYIVDAKGHRWNQIRLGENQDAITGKVERFVDLAMRYDVETDFSTVSESLGSLVDSVEYMLQEDAENGGEPLYNEAEQEEMRRLATEIDEAYENWDDEAHLDEDGEPTNLRQYLFEHKLSTKYTTRQIAKIAKEQGNDGVIIENVYDNGKFTDVTGIHGFGNVYIAFNSNQIKSVDNQNPTPDPDIRFSLSDIDGEYMTAVENGDMATAQRLVYEAAERAGYTDDTSWKMQHTAPNSRDDVSLADLRNTDLVPSDYWDHPEWYTSSAEERESFYKIQKAFRIQDSLKEKGNPREPGMWVYRAVDKTRNTKEEKIRNGDWVTPSYDYAANEGKMNPNGYRIIKQFAKLKDLWWDGNSIAELGYDDGNAYAYADTKNNRKLLDAVTYDSFGEVIPLSKRFNKRIDDVRYSLSENEVVPRRYGNYNVYGRDIALEQDIAPVKEIDRFAPDYAPLTEEQANERDAERSGDEFVEVPDDYDLDDLIYNGAFANHPKPPDPFIDRDIWEVGRDRKAKAYMYEHPEVKPFFQQEAEYMLGELNRSVKGERFYNDKLYYDTNGESGIFGTKRETSEEIAYLLDTFNYTYKDIAKGLNAIIEDNGKENNAISKRIEFMLDERLRLGYTDFGFGDKIEPNQDYINLLNSKEITEYNDESWNNWLRNLSDDDIKTHFSARDNVVPPEEYIAAESDIAPVRETVEPEAPLYETATGQQTMFEEPKKPQTLTRSTLHKNIIKDIKDKFVENALNLDDVLKDAKNLSTFATVDNIPQRVMEKALGYKAGQVLSDVTVNKVAQNETEGIKWLNSFTNRQNGLLRRISKQYHIKPGSKESAAAQMYAEGFYVNDNNEIISYGDAELAKDFPNREVQANIRGLAKDERIRQIYDETLRMINESRARNAYPEIPRLDNYFLHFRAMEDTFSRLGLPFNPNDIRAKDLPTDLNGVTADLKPGQPYFASAMHRTGKRTSFDLLGGLERYLTSAKNQIYHIDDIQTLRALRNYIADTYGQANGLEGLDALSEEEAQERIQKVYSAHLSTFAKFLNEEANVLAGKTALIDRGFEGMFGRRAFTFMDTLNKQVGSNMVGFNVSSSLTNFLPVVQTFAKSNKADFVKAFAQTASNKINSIFGRSDGFADQSPVMIRRKGADRFYRTWWQKRQDEGYFLMGVVDNISTELIARTKYNELVRKGMDEQKAHYETDKWVSRLMGDRSLGQLPQLYNSKTLGIITKFQLEVRNQLDSQFYDTIQEAKVSNEDIQNGLARNAKTAAKVASTFVQLAVAQHLFGKAFESVAGYNPAFDIIDVLLTACGYDDEEDSEDTALDNIEQGFLALLEDLPYTSTFTGGRIPISSALPITELIKGEDKYGVEKSRAETFKEIAPYYVLPTGYGQIKKTAQGLSMFDDDLPIAGSYTDSGNLRFPIEDTTENRIKAGLFGQWASENARDYFDNERTPLKEKQIQEFIDVDIPIRDYWEYREGLSGLENLSEKADYINSLDLPIDKKNILINNLTDRKEEVDLTGFDEDYADFEEFDFAVNNPEKYEIAQKVGGYKAYVSYKEGMSGLTKLEEKADYIASLDLTTEQKNALINGETDRKEPIDMTGYENYGSFDEFDYAQKNPGKHAISKAVGGYESYVAYLDELNDIRADKDADGDSIPGSAKEKKWAYINGLNLDYGQKIILYRSLYDSKADKAELNVDIVQYLDSRDDITYDEMVTILEELDMKMYPDGRVTW